MRKKKKERKAKGKQRKRKKKKLSQLEYYIKEEGFLLCGIIIFYGIIAPKLNDHRMLYVIKYTGKIMLAVDLRTVLKLRYKTNRTGSARF